MTQWSNLAKIVYRRTYARSDKGSLERWEDTTDRVIQGNVRIVDPKFLMEGEIERLSKMMIERKAMPAGRGIWFSGSPGHARFGGAALNNCWYFSMDDWMNFVLIQDMLMLGGGTGASVEHRFVSKLPPVRRSVAVYNKEAKDADFIIPDSREGWCELTRRILEAFLVTGRGFSYSTVCIRGSGEKIKGFGGVASGPLPLVSFAKKICAILVSREDRHLRPIDVADIICAIGEMVVAGNVRRSAIILLGDPWDKEYLRAKRWDLGVLPTQRSMANWSVVADTTEDLHPLFWDTYEHGEPFGLINRKNIQKFARMGELKKDNAVGVNPCVAGDTEILTRSGYQPIESLVGQKIDVWNGFEWSEVEPRVTGYEQPMVTISLSDGRSLRCTEAHKWVIVEGYDSKQTQSRVSAIDLKVGQKLLKIEYPVVEMGEEIDSRYAYTQGFVSAEGMDGYKYCQVYDPKMSSISRMLGRPGVYNEKGGRLLFRLERAPLSKDFVPFSWNLSSRLQWLAGLFDGDGCELKEGGLQLASVSPGFLRDVQKMLTLCGAASKVVPGNEAGSRLLPNGYGGNSYYPCQKTERLCVGASTIQALVDLGLKCERLKFEKKPNRDASRFVTVTGIAESGTEGTVYCFTEPKRNLGCFDGIVTGQCAEATLVSGEACNLFEISLYNIMNEAEFEQAARLGFRYAKRVAQEKYHHDLSQSAISKNQRVGIGITGCMASPDLFKKSVLDRVYHAIQDENRNYSAQLGVPESIRTTVIKPSGTLSKIMDHLWAAGVHGGYSRHQIQRMRFAANDPLIPLLRSAGHHMEPTIRFDGSLDPNTLVVDFYSETPDEVPVADEGYDTWAQLDTLLMAQKHWADQAVSVTIYYKREDVPRIKAWLTDNLQSVKTISFLCHQDHGFKQAPWEAISKEEYINKSKDLKEIDFDSIGGDNGIDMQDCEAGACPIK